MQHFPRRFTIMRLAALTLFAFTCCSGCSLGNALLDGVFLGISETIGTLLGGAVAG